MRFTRRRTIGGLAALPLVAVVSTAATTDAMAQSGHGRPATCSTYSGTDYSHLTLRDAANPGNGPGDSVVYHDEMIDAAGAQIGTLDGTALAFLHPQTGALMETLTAVAFMPDGQIYGTGQIDVVAAQTQWQTLRAVGTTGKLRGKVGTWKWRLIAQPAPDLTIFQGELRVCG